MQLLKAADLTPIEDAAHTDITASYWRQGEEPTAITLVALTDINSAWDSGGWKKAINIAGTVEQKGIYRLDLPNAMVATGADEVTLHVEHADGVYQALIPLEAKGAAELFNEIGASGANLTDIPRLDATVSSVTDAVAAALTTLQGLLATLQGDTDNLQTRLPAALVNGRIDASVGAMDTGVVTATAIAADAITSAKIAADAIGSSELASSAVTEIQSGLATSTALETTSTLVGDLINAIGTPAQAGDAMALTSGERTTLINALLDLANGIETGLTPRQAARLAVSALAGKLSGAGTSTEVFRNAVADSKNRITATVTEAGNRTAITTDLT